MMNETIVKTLKIYNSSNKVIHTYETDYKVNDDGSVTETIKVYNSLGQLMERWEHTTEADDNSMFLGLRDQDPTCRIDQSPLRIGDMYYNTVDKKFKIVEKITPNGVIWHNVDTSSDGLLGTPSDGAFSNGMIELTPETKTADAVDKINELLKYLAPDDAEPLSGDIKWNNALAIGKISDNVVLNNLNNGNICYRIIKSNIASGETPNKDTKFNQADKGKLQLIVNDINIDEFDLASEFNEAYRDGCQIYPPKLSTNQNIRIDKVCKYNDFPLWQKGEATILIHLDSVTDYKVKLQHDTGTIYSTNTDILFYDNETGRPGIDTLDQLVFTDINLKYLSGIKFLTIGTRMVTSFTTNNKIFEYTYVDNPLLLLFPGMTDVEITLDDNSVSGVSSIPKYNENITVTEKELILNDINVCTDEAKLLVIPRDPWGNGSAKEETISEKRLVNTYGNVSTNTIEYFQDENYRLPDNFNFDNKLDDNPLVGYWASNTPLSNGDAQVFNGKLIYPQTDFTSGYQPEQNINTDYSTFTGDQIYYRSFYEDGVPHNSGTVALGNVTWNDVANGKIKVEIKLPGQTGWLDLSKDYNPALFVGADGEGAMTGHTEANGRLYIDWSSGIYSTSNSKFRYFIRITITDPTVELNYLAEVGW